MQRQWFFAREASCENGRYWFLVEFFENGDERPACTRTHRCWTQQRLLFCLLVCLYLFWRTVSFLYYFLIFPPFFFFLLYDSLSLSFRTDLLTMVFVNIAKRYTRSNKGSGRFGFGIKTGQSIREERSVCIWRIIEKNKTGFDLSSNTDAGITQHISGHFLSFFLSFFLSMLISCFFLSVFLLG